MTAGLADGLDDQSVVDPRRRWVADERAAISAAAEASCNAAARKHPLDPVWVSHCIDRAKDARCIVINEYTLFPDHCRFEFPDLYFGSSSASGLGWGPGAALGAKLARPDSPVMAVVGDGAICSAIPLPYTMRRPCTICPFSSSS